MENEKVYEWISKWPLIVGGCMYAVIGIALTIAEAAHDGLIALGPLILMSAVGVFGFHQAWKKLRNVRVILSDAGLRRTSIYGEYFIPWNEMRLLKIRRDRRGRVKSIAAASAQGKRIFLVGLESMDEIAAFIDSHATAPQPDSSIADALSNPYVSWPISIVGLIGIGLVAFANDRSEMTETGYWLIAASVVPSIWLYRNNLLATLSSKTAWKYWSKSVLLRFALFLAIFAILLLIVFVMKR